MLGSGKITPARPVLCNGILVLSLAYPSQRAPASFITIFHLLSLFDFFCWSLLILSCKYLARPSRPKPKTLEIPIQHRFFILCTYFPVFTDFQLSSSDLGVIFTIRVNQ